MKFSFYPRQFLSIPVEQGRQHTEVSQRRWSSSPNLKLVNLCLDQNRSTVKPMAKQVSNHITARTTGPKLPLEPIVARFGLRSPQA